MTDIALTPNGIGHIITNAMARRPDGKTAALRAEGALHPHPEAVQDPLFDQHPFFDRRDAVQVKYEMLRRVEIDGAPIATTAEAFGFSRPTFYQAQAAFAQAGLPGLLPQKRGPRGPHKLRADVLAFVLAERAAEGASARVLAARIHERFGISIHPRSIERAWRRQEKKRR
jgi:transposase